MKITGAAFALLFLLTIPAANWAIGNVGVVCVPDGPCLVPVLPGLMAPSGVLFIGLALVLRDAVQEALGVAACALLIALGAALSMLVAPAAIALASFVAFAVSEGADLAVYTPLRRRGLVLAVLASGAVGAVVDSVAFLWIAFGSLDFLAGQVVGKVEMSVLGALILVAAHRRLA